MTTGLQRVAAYIGSSHVERSLRSVLERRHALRIVPVTLFRQLKRACLVSLVVMDLSDPAADVTSSLLEVRSRWPGVPVLGCAPPATGPRLMSSLPDMVSAGITVVTDWHAEALDRVITRVLDGDARVLGMAAHFDRELRAIDSPWVAEFCRTCLDAPFESTTVGLVTRRLGGTRQHIAAEFQRVGMDSPGRFVTLARLGHVVDRVAWTGDGWTETAMALRWSSPEALRRALQRHVGLTAASGMTVSGRRHVHALIRQFLGGARSGAQ